MAIALSEVAAGSILKINEAEKSGAWGGFMVGVIFFVTTLILFEMCIRDRLQVVNLAAKLKLKRICK